MQSALIVHSRHTRNFARQLSKKYKEVTFLEIVKPPTEEVFKIKNNKAVVIGVGGGSVIDTAKIISGNKRCIAIPTTASGAAITPYATVWGKEKMTIPAKKPILRNSYSVPKHLSGKVLQSTLFDALSHAVESLWSKNSTPKSRSYSKKAIHLINRYLNGKIIDADKLITAGNLSGQAIAITKTNIVHSVSYPITIKYGVDHGTACGMLLPYFIEYIDFRGLPELFDLNSTEELVKLLKKKFVMPIIERFDTGLITEKAIKYDKINDGPKRINKIILHKILHSIKKDIREKS